MEFRLIQFPPLFKGKVPTDSATCWWWKNRLDFDSPQISDWSGNGPITIETLRLSMEFFAWAVDSSSRGEIYLLEEVDSPGGIICPRGLTRRGELFAPGGVPAENPLMPKSVYFLGECSKQVWIRLDQIRMTYLVSWPLFYSQVCYLRCK